MPMRHGGSATLSFRSAAAQPGHFGRGAGLVDEDQALRIKVRLGGEPGPAPDCDVGPLLLGGVRRFFEGHAVSVQAAPDGAGPERSSMLGPQQIGQLDQADIFLRRHGGQDDAAERPDAM